MDKNVIVDEIGDNIEVLRATIVSKLNLSRAYTSDELRLILIESLTGFLSMEDLNRWKWNVIDYKLFNIPIYRRNSSYFLSKNVSVDITLVQRESVIITLDDLEDKPLSTIVELYLNIVNDWVNSAGRCSTTDYIRAVERLQSLMGINKDQIDDNKRLKELIKIAEDKLKL